jgi:uncharacterized protein YjiS (DUF1127 family)
MFGGIEYEEEALFGVAQRAWAARIFASLRVYLMRRRQRSELLDYLATDHRAAADIGVTSYEAKLWAERPFWRE